VVVLVVVVGPFVVFVVTVDVDVWYGHIWQEAQNHWSQASCQPLPKVEHRSMKHSAVVVVLLLVVVVPVPFVVVWVMLFVVVVVELVVLVYGHCVQPLQYQFAQAASQPPGIVEHSVGRH
jgi:hypothetical protein